MMLDTNPEVAGGLTEVAVLLETVVELLEGLPLLAGTDTANGALQCLHFSQLALAESVLAVVKLQAHSRLDTKPPVSMSAGEFIRENADIYEKGGEKK